MGKIPDFDATAVVVDNHTGRVLAKFQGLGAEGDAIAHSRVCQTGGVKHMSSTSVIIGKAAAKAWRDGKA